MKIEIGESLLYSWLRHIKMCRLVQMNWKSSRIWPLQEQDKLNTFMEETATHFQGQYGYNIYKDSKGLLQLLQQAEIDVVGVNTDNAATSCFAVDVAFHIGGTNYGSRNETVERIIKKILRTSMCLCGHIGVSSGEIIFAAPKITPSVMWDLKGPLEDINRMFYKTGFDFTASIIANQDFFEKIIIPVLSISGDVADTTELFLRSYQLMGMFAQRNKVDKQGIASEAVDFLAMEKDMAIVSNPRKDYILHGKPCNAQRMHIALVHATEAHRTLCYKDGRTCTDIWDTRKYTADSNLARNLASGPLRSWKDKGIVGVKIEIN